MKFWSFFALTALVLASATASAELLCKRCEITDENLARYLGAFWPGDDATFQNKRIVQDCGTGSCFGNAMVFDLNATGDVTVSAAPLPGREFIQGPILDIVWSMQLNVDEASTTCDAKFCEMSENDGALIGHVNTTSTTDGLAFTVEALPPGRYIVSIRGTIDPEGVSGYKGAISVR